MKLSLFAVVSLVGLSSAFPADLLNAIADIEALELPSIYAALDLSKSRTNCGPTPCGVFNAQEQFVSTTGEHAYAKPRSNQIRGPCPALNAAANHGYLDRSGGFSPPFHPAVDLTNTAGVTTLPETVSGLGAAFGMSTELSAFLAAYAIIMNGNPLDGTWSIGGPPPTGLLGGLTSGLLGDSQGISYSHNIYEGDTSIGRNDAYLNNGDAHSLNVTRFASAYATGLGNDRYTLDGFAQDFLKKVQESIANNPYYFAAPFSTTLVAPVAYNFVINLMSNHSAAEPDGYLDGETFKAFFGVTGDYPNFKWLKGQERIPDNWYRRPSSVPYGIPNGFLDLAINFQAYPGTLRLGGNTNGVNTYVGVDLSDITGGVYHSSDLLNLKTSNAACFYAQVVQAVIPDGAAPLLGKLSAILNLVNKWIKPITGSFKCGIIGKYDQTLFNKFPGYKYRPKGQATIYKE
ncbi:uncharacterized protein LTR77_002560 [Saxophila tyrrhenica]|uniref:Heme haloperoxidase family profile domain-containing protein n=1 Tax=Saxophila tyrrhenica TaxID=1690608 RepID=A0AAV9PJ03_9PEZI|nr:hypothetical protein LTR77_002560 [Saxophila tyrrhenica]